MSAFDLPTGSEVSGAATSRAFIRDEKSAGTNGGTFTQGAWRTRDLNTEVFDPDGIVSISSNQFTLGAGTYELEWFAVAGYVNSHQSRIYNVTDTSVVEVGSLHYSGRADGSYITDESRGRARLTIAGTKVFELQHICISTDADEGFGAGRNWGDGTVGVFAGVFIEKVA